MLITSMEVKMQKSIYVYLLRSVHGLFAIYFIACIAYIYYAAITLKIDLFLGVAVVSLLIEGLLVFVLNSGDCPLIHLQRKLDDPVPFFNLFLPAHLAKKAIPFFTGIMLLGIVLLIVRLLLKG
jgi:hypothetical protein